MTIKELIEHLQQLDPNLYVFVDGYERGYDEFTITDEKEIALNVNRAWYYGHHEGINEGIITNKNKDKHRVVKGIILKRK